jgi:hypothetical protein
LFACCVKPCFACLGELDAVGGSGSGRARTGGPVGGCTVVDTAQGPRQSLGPCTARYSSLGTVWVPAIVHLPPGQARSADARFGPPCIAASHKSGYIVRRARAGTERAAATTTSIPTVNRGASGMRLHFASAFATNPTRPRCPLARWRLLKPPRRLSCACSPCSMPSRHRDGHPLRRLTAFAGCLSPPPATPRLPSCC